MSPETNPNVVAEAVFDVALTLDPRLHGTRGIRVQALSASIRQSKLRITDTEAVEACRHWYAHSKELLTGNDLVATIRRRRQATALADNTGPPQRPATVSDREAVESLHSADERQIIRTHVCPFCGAAAGVLCRNTLTGSPLREFIAGHPQRVAKAYGRG